MRAGQTHYTPPAGIPELRQAVAKLYTEHHGVATEPPQVVVSNGAKHSIHNALMAVCGPGDEVIIPSPYWVSYADLVKLTGARPVVVQAPESEGFKLTPEQFLGAVTPRTKLLMINSPSNPTGVVYERSELAALADAVLKTEVGVLSDEIYEQLTYDDAKPTCFASSRPRAAGPDDHDLGRQQDLRHDRLADRLERGPGGGLQVHGRSPEPGDQQSLLDQPVGGPGGDHRPARDRSGDEGPVRQASRVRSGADRAAAGRDLHSPRGRLLRLHERVVPLRQDAGRAEDRRFDVVLHGGPRPRPTSRS